MTDKPATERQQRILDVIRAFTVRNGLPALGPRDRRAGGAFILVDGPVAPQDARTPRAAPRATRPSRGPCVPADAGRVCRRRRAEPSSCRSSAGRRRRADHRRRRTSRVTFVLPARFRAARIGRFMLRVKGDSMVEAAILDGDLIVVAPQPTAENGEIVVAMIDGEATVKRFYRESGPDSACSRRIAAWSQSTRRCRDRRTRRGRRPPPLAHGRARARRPRTLPRSHSRDASSHRVRRLLLALAVAFLRRSRLGIRRRGIRAARLARALAVLRRHGGRARRRAAAQARARRLHHRFAAARRARSSRSRFSLPRPFGPDRSGVLAHRRRYRILRRDLAAGTSRPASRWRARIVRSVRKRRAARARRLRALHADVSLRRDRVSSSRRSGAWATRFLALFAIVAIADAALARSAFTARAARARS